MVLGRLVVGVVELIFDFVSGVFHLVSSIFHTLIDALPGILGGPFFFTGDSEEEGRNEEKKRKADCLEHFHGANLIARGEPFGFPNKDGGYPVSGTHQICDLHESLRQIALIGNPLTGIHFDKVR